MTMTRMTMNFPPGSEMTNMMVHKTSYMATRTLHSTFRTLHAATTSAQLAFSAMAAISGTTSLFTLPGPSTTSFARSFTLLVAFFSFFSPLLVAFLSLCLPLSSSQFESCFSQIAPSRLVDNALLSLLRGQDLSRGRGHDGSIRSRSFDVANRQHTRVDHDRRRRCDSNGSGGSGGGGGSSGCSQSLLRGA